MTQLIVAGDSQSAARGSVTLYQTWGSIVSRRMGIDCTNCAISGNTSTDLLNRFGAVVANPGPLLGIMIGANDAYLSPSYTPAPPYSAPQPSAVSVDQYDANLRAMVVQARDVGKTVFFVTPWAFWSTVCIGLAPGYVGGQFSFYVARMKSVAADLGLSCFDAYQIQFDIAAAVGQIDMWNDFEADYQHPNAAGHWEISRVISL